MSICMILGVLSSVRAEDKELGSLVVIERTFDLDFEKCKASFKNGKCKVEVPYDSRLEKLYKGTAYFFTDENNNFNISIEADEKAYSIHVSEMFGRRYSNPIDVNEQQLNVIKQIISEMKNISVLIQKIKM